MRAGILFSSSSLLAYVVFTWMMPETTGNLYGVPTIVNITHSVKIYYDDFVDLVCTATGYPVPDIVWVSPSNGTNTSSQVIGKGNRSSSLTVLGVHGGGIYKCRATNICGTVEAQVSVEVPIHIFDHTPDLNVSSHSTVSLTCSAVGYPQPLELVWISPFGTSTGMITNPDHDKRTLTLTVNISMAAQENNGGNYTCRAVNYARNISSATTILFVSPRIVRSSCCNYPITVMDWKRLYCTALGFPIPNVVWIAPDKARIQGDSNVIKHLTRRESTLLVNGSDGGHYQCIAENGIGVPTVANFTVWVVADIYKIQADTKTVKAYDIFSPVTCIGVGFPRPSVNWMRRKVLTGRVSNMYNIGRTQAGQNLTLGQVTLSDRGSYICRATNTINDRVHSFQRNFSLVINSDVLIASVSQTADGFVNGTVRLHCSTSGKSEHKIFWKNSMMKTRAANKHGGNVTLELKALRMKDGNKKYFCEARTSEDGSRVKSTSVMVRVLSPKLEFHDKAVFVGEKNGLKCAFSANPIPQAKMSAGGRELTSAVARSTVRQYIWEMVYRNASTWHLRHGGNYFCTVFYANTSVNVSAMASVRILPYIKQGPVKVPANGSTPHNLSCTASSYPLPEVEWIRLINDKSYGLFGNKVFQKVVGNDTVTSVLIFKEFSVASAGDYRCVVRSTIDVQRPPPPGYRNSSSLVSFLVSSTAAIISSSSVIARWGSKLVIRCRVTGYPLPNITWTFRDQHRVTGTTVNRKATSSESVLVFDNVTAEFHGGKYTCSAHNGIESSASSVTVIVITAIDSGCSDETLHIIAAAVAVAVGIVIVQLSLFALWRRYRKRKDASMSTLTKAESDTGNKFGVANTVSIRARHQGYEVTSSRTHARSKSALSIKDRKDTAFRDAKATGDAHYASLDLAFMAPSSEYDVVADKRNYAGNQSLYENI